MCLQKLSSARTALARESYLGGPTGVPDFQLLLPVHVSPAPLPSTGDKIVYIFRMGRPRLVVLRLVY